MKKLLFIALAGLSAQYTNASWVLTDSEVNGTAFTTTTVADGDIVSYNATGTGNHATTALIGLDVSLGFVGTATSTPTVTDNNTSGVNATGFSLTDIGGLTSITITANYDQFISGRTTNPTALGFFPWGMAVNVVNPGTGVDATGFTTDLTVENIVRLTDVTDVSTATTTLNPLATPYDTASYESSSIVGNTLTLSSADGFIDDDFSLIRGLNDDGAGNFTATDAQTYYADTFTITITADDPNGFAADADFRFSFDGDQQLSGVVPEPSSVLLLSLGGLGLALRRKR